MNKRISRDLLLTCVALTGLVSAQMCLADDIPRPELGCRLLDADGTPIDRADFLDSVNYDDRLRDNYDVRSTGVIVAVSWL